MPLHTHTGQILNTFAPSNFEGEGVANQLLFQPVFPVSPLSRFPVGQIIRPSVPLAITTPGPDRTTGFGDISLFDILLPERFSWGAFGVGPSRSTTCRGAGTSA